MASSATRSSVAAYERCHNAFLCALRPGGILFDCAMNGPAEALLVPRQISLRRHSLNGFLRLGASSSPQMVAAASHTCSPNEALPGHDSRYEQNAEHGEDDGDVGADTSDDTDWGAVAVTDEQRKQLRDTLVRFLQHHLLHFPRAGDATFMTATGATGQFSDTLDCVRLVGRIGRCAVITDMDPLYPKCEIAAAASPTSSPTPPPPHQMSLAPTVAQGSDNTDVLLHAFSFPGAPLSAAATTTTTSPTQPVLPKGHPATLQLYLVDEPLMDSDELRALRRQLEAAVTLRQVPHVGNHAATGTASRTPTPLPLDASQVQPQTGFTGLELGPAGDDDDIVVEEDLTPYQSKSARRGHRGGESSAAAASAGRATGSGFAAPARAAAAERHPTAVMRDATGATTAPTTGSAQTAATSNIAITTTAPQPEPPVLVGRVAQPAPRKHADLSRHQYNRESIKDYRRVVSADNDIGYDQFEKLMESSACLPLVRLVSQYVEAAQMRGRGLKDNHSFLILMESAKREITKIPSVSSHPRRTTILLEGIEKYTTSKLYFMLFNVDERERHMNNLLQDKFHRADGLSARQLDALAEVEDHHVWGQAMFELDGMNFFKSPREKLRCGMRACELLSLAVGDILAAKRAATARLGDAGNTSAGSGTEAAARKPDLAFGADEFLPCFMLLVLRAQPYNFYQNVQYIEKFRLEDLRAPEESYCLANLMSAQEFWLNCSDDGKLGDPASVAGDISVPGPQASEPPPYSAEGPAITAPATSAGSVGGPQKGLVVRTVPAPPPMQHEDLLPSLLQASRARHWQSTETSTTAATGSATARAAALAADKGPSIMDKLFDFMRPDGTEPAAAAEAAASPLEFLSRLGTSGTRRPDGAPPPPPPPLAQVVTHVATGIPAHPRMPSIISLLGVQNRAFEDLSESELRTIVEEARAVARQSH